MKMNPLLIAISLLCTGIMAGLFFTWTNTVTTGIGRLDDLAYLSAFQQMNRTILNFWFFLFFLLPLLTLPFLVKLNFSPNANYDFRFILVASLLYLFGVIIITFLGNIPINELLDQTQLNSLDKSAYSELRLQIESKWNNLNRIRTISSIGTFLILIFVTLFN